MNGRRDGYNSTAREVNLPATPLRKIRTIRLITGDKDSTIQVTSHATVTENNLTTHRKHQGNTLLLKLIWNETKPNLHLAYIFFRTKYTKYMFLYRALVASLRFSRLL